MHHFSLPKVRWWWGAVSTPDSHSCKKGGLKPTESCVLVCFLGLLSFHRWCQLSWGVPSMYEVFNNAKLVLTRGKYKASRSWSFLFFKNTNVAASTLSSLGGGFLPHDGLFVQQEGKWWRYQPPSILVYGLPLYQLMSCCPLSFLGICSLSFEDSEASPQFFLSWERRCCSS